jgi:outer membrane lipoprotein-sorting protein
LASGSIAAPELTGLASTRGGGIFICGRAGICYCSTAQQSTEIQIMKMKSLALLAAALGLSFLSASAQPGGMGGGPSGPNFSGSISKLFGDNKTFSATIEIQAVDGSAGDTTIPGKLSFDDGKSRFEMDLEKMKNSKMPPQAAEQMKAMGMDKMVIIARPDKKLNYMIYSSLSAYVEMPATDATGPEALAKYKVVTTELGKETVNGHACVKNKVVVTDDKNKQHESTVWNATDLKNFPVKIETTERGTKLTMLFKDVKLTKPEVRQFEAPSGMKRYDNMMALMQEEMMKRMGGDMAIPGR